MKLRHALRGTAAGLLLAVCLTTPTLALTGVVDVGGSVLRVRKTASTGSAVLDQLSSGKQVEIVDTATNGWYGIRLGSVKGYVSASYIKLLEEAAPVVTAEVSAVSASAAHFIRLLFKVFSARGHAALLLCDKAVQSYLLYISKPPFVNKTYVVRLSKNLCC